MQVHGRKKKALRGAIDHKEKTANGGLFHRMVEIYGKKKKGSETRHDGRSYTKVDGGR